MKSLPGEIIDVIVICSAHNKTKLRRLISYTLISANIIVYCTTSWAGKLDDFEAGTAKTKNQETIYSKDSHTEYNRKHFNDSGGFLDAFANLIFEIISGVIVAGGENSYERVTNIAPSSDSMTQIPIRKIGEPLIPYFRLDLNYQNVESDVTALDGRVEIGYGPFGLQIRQTNFEEDSPSDKLSLTYIHGLYRMSFSKSATLDLGLGSASLDGNNDRSGFSLTTPLQLHLTNNIGFQFRPSWSWINDNQIDDYDLSMILTKGPVSIQTGYRWLHQQSNSLNGAYLGFSIHY